MAHADREADGSTHKPIADLTDPLRGELVALAGRLTRQGIILTVGGGYGLVLKREYIVNSNLRTRFTDALYTRSTNDVDCFLTADLISDGEVTRTIREALNDMQYDPVESAKFFQFKKAVTYEGAPVILKFDFLAPLITDPVLTTRVKIDDRRTRPRSYGELHAHTTPEAATIEELPTTVELGTTARSATVRLPHPFTYIILKLHALGDQVNDPGKRYGSNHAFDIYTTIALMTELEWDEMMNLRDQYAGTTSVARARELRTELFGELTSLGFIRMREYAVAAGIHINPERFGDIREDLRAILEA
jgi:hypothetical protein